MCLWMMRFGSIYTLHEAAELEARELHSSSWQVTRPPVAVSMAVAANEYLQVTSCRGASAADFQRAM
jgi:hypothetical protein